MFSILAFWQGKARARGMGNSLKVAIGSSYHGRDREVGNGLRVAIGGGYRGSFRVCQNAKLL